MVRHEVTGLLIAGGAVAFLGGLGLLAASFASPGRCDRECRVRALKATTLLAGLGLPAAGIGVGLHMSPDRCPSCQRPLF